MDRFVAFSWDWRDVNTTAQVDVWSDHLRLTQAGWRIALKRSGLVVLAMPRSDGALPITVGSDKDLVIVGSLFRRQSAAAAPLRALPSNETEKIVSSGGRALLDSYWGSFIAFWREQESGALSVVRDPCGSTTCFRVRMHGVNVLCSYLGDTADLPGIRLSIDWNSVAAFLIHDYFITEHTGFKEVEEVLPGSLLCLRPDGRETRAWLWNPVEVAANPKRQTFEQAKEEVRAIAGDCFRALGSFHPKIAIRLSGGLDSSIVANLMRRSCESQITGIHLLGKGYEVFELQLARLAAKHAGVELLELELSQSTADLDDILAAPRVARPTGQILGAAADALISDACTTLGATCIMTGHGGDSLFLQRSVAKNVFVDFVRLNGPSLRLGHIAYETAVLTQSPVWSVMKNAVAHLTGKKRWEPYAFLSDDGADGGHSLLPEASRAVPASYMTHPWLEDALGLPPAKAEQVRGIIALRNYHPLLSHGINFDAVQPFISQPLVEFCLRTPSYLFGQGGVDRALEREAFEDVIPAEISRRFQKGFVNHHLAEDIAANAPTLSAFLLEGSLVSNGIADRRNVERLFSADAVGAGRGLTSILALLAAEAWATNWRSHLAAA